MPVAADLPALALATALPALAPAPAEAQSTSPPVRIVIPTINLDLKPIPVGVDAQNVPIVPKHDVGWFKNSAAPGEGSNVVFWGHVLRWVDSPNTPAPFERVQELQAGAQITILTADGRSRQYRVTQQVRVKPEDTSLLFPSLGERVTLVSCIGDKVIQNGTLSKKFRLVTIAEPIR